MKISILTVMPSLFDSFIASPVPARAIRNQAVSIEIIDIREFAGGSFRHIDDSTFGGGKGMILRPDPVLRALAAAKSCSLEELLSQRTSGSAQAHTGDVTQDASDSAQAHTDGVTPSTSSVITRNVTPDVPTELTIALSPRGKTFHQKTARQLAALDHLILICGHYEGMDERIYQYVDACVSIGDYILTGGELPAQIVTDAVIRLLPGVLKDEVTQDESFEQDLLEYPQYTQPADYYGDVVPDVLRSGNHAAIEKWRQEQALSLTKRYRPDLLDNR